MNSQKSYVYIATFLITLHINVAQAAAEKSSTIPWGVSARQGKRPTMEDAHAVVPAFEGDDAQTFLAIYDGHEGAKAARIAANGAGSGRSLHAFLAESEADTLVNRYREAFQKSDRIIIDSDGSGTTAITAHINTETKTVTFAHVGDSRALLIRGNTIAATTDHKPSTPSEKKRILAAGGIITQHDPIDRLKGAKWTISFSRALGDRMQKIGIFKTKGLIATPEINATSYPGDANTVLVFACDGVWDVLSNEEAAAIVTNALNADPIESLTLPDGESAEVGGNNLAAKCAAYILCNAAYDKGSTDNISVLVALLHKVSGKPFATEFTQAEPFQKLYDVDFPQDAPALPEISTAFDSSDTDSSSDSSSFSSDDNFNYDLALHRAVCQAHQ